MDGCLRGPAAVEGCYEMSRHWKQLSGMPRDDSSAERGAELLCSWRTGLLGFGWYLQHRWLEVSPSPNF